MIKVIETRRFTSNSKTDIFCIIEMSLQEKTIEMKKVLLIFVMAFVFSACTQCQDCTLDGVTSEVCKDDFDSNADYQAALSTLEELGADCR